MLIIAYVCPFCQYAHAISMGFFIVNSLMKSHGLILCCPIGNGEKGLIMKIIRVTEVEQNDFYDSRRCHDGGGYSQPHITIEFDDGISIVIDDTSCGDFGSRVTAWVYMGVQLGL